MSIPFKRRKLTHLIGVALIGSTAVLSGCNDDDDDEGQNVSTTAAATTLTRLAALPLGSEATGMFVSGAGDLFFNTQHPSDSNTAPHNKAAVGVITGMNINTLADDFTAVAVPSSDADKQMVTLAQGAYQILIQEGTTLASSNNVAGEIRTADDSAIIKQSNDPDFNAFISTNADNTAGYLFTNWEDRPGGMSRIELTKDSASGQWTVGNGLMVDFSSVQGTWVNCFGTLSPWGTPLTAEELYFDDTADWFDSTGDNFSNPQAVAEYLGFATDGAGAWPNPYRYGYIVEITDPTGTPTPRKLFSNGRFSHENSVVMPDNKTVYLSDDGSDVVFYKFIADAAGDLTAGTLYAAKFTQAADAVEDKDYSFSIEWIELAHGNNTTIETWIAEYDNQTGVVDGAASFITDADVAAWAADKMDNGVLDTVADDRAAFLESRKAAKAMGATAEFTKMEGVNINYAAAKDGSVPYMYMAMADVKGGMSDSEGDIQIPENRCGIVYRMGLDSSYNVSAMTPVVIGGPYDSTAADNKCATNNIASPDNVAILADGRVLIGEDTSKHQNNMIWVWDEN